MLHNSRQKAVAPQEHAILIKMKMVTDRVSAMFSERAKKDALPLPSPTQCRVILCLKNHKGGPVSQRELERHLGVTHSTAKGILQRMEERGLVRTAFDSADGRVKNAYLTEESERLQESAEGLSREMEELMLAGMDEEERRQLDALLARVFDNVVS